MARKSVLTLLVTLLAVNALPQNRPQAPDEQTIRIGTELIQLDAVVVDKSGKAVRGLTRNDFELYENGKKQHISFFEVVEADKGTRSVEREGEPVKPAEQASTTQGPAEKDIRRIFAFVIDDLTIRREDLLYVRQMLTSFLDTQMQSTDLVAIVRTVGGKGLLQSFSTDKDLLHRAVASLTPTNHPFNVFNPQDTTFTSVQDAMTGAGAGNSAVSQQDTAGSNIDVGSETDDTNTALRAYMTLGTASFVIDSMKALPGRKSLILVSGGLPILTSNTMQDINSQSSGASGPGAGTATGDVSYFLRRLTDRATRAGVVINTLDIRGLSAQVGVASFDNTPGKSSMGAGRNTHSGRVMDVSMLGDRNPFDVMGAHTTLRELAGATGGVAVLNKNDFNQGLAKIVGNSDVYYLIAYTPENPNFKDEFRKTEIKVKGGYKVYSRSGYFARVDKPASAPATKQDELLEAIKSPLARHDVNLDAMVLYKAKGTNEGGIDIDIVLDPAKLSFEQVGDKRQTSIEVAGFVFDELGKMRGGFSDTINPSLTPGEFARVTANGLPYTKSTTLPAGIYQVRLAVRDNKTGALGTLQRYLEVPDLSKGRLAASSLLLGSAPAGEVKATEPTPISANRRISQARDLRYAVVIYNAKLRDHKPQVKAGMAISQNGKVLYKEPEEPVPTVVNDSGQVIKFGQLGLSHVAPGRYTITVVITDPLADKKAQTIIRAQDFTVVK
jgi:VWFA-related protein